MQRLPTTVALLSGLVAAGQVPAQPPTPSEIEQLTALVAAQQLQIDAMRAEIDALKAAGTVTAAAARPTSAPVPEPVSSAASRPMLADAVPARATAPTTASADENDGSAAQMVAEGFTWKDASGRSLTLSGQVNPAFNLVDDGLSTQAFVVDNDSSGARFRLDADAPLGSTRLGATLEIGASPNNSSDVSQLDPQTPADVNVRRAEVFFSDPHYGRLALGQGSGAADGAAEKDLSLVAGPIMYASVADIAGGILFTDGTGYSTTTVGDAFSDFNGGRLARVRYDTPSVGPLQGAFSWGQDDQWAVAATLGGSDGWVLGAFTLLGGAAVYGTDDDEVDYTYAASASVVHDPTGLNLTLSTGGQARDGDSDPSNIYGKLGWQTDFGPLGPTGVGIDYTRGRNVSGPGTEGTSFGLAAVQRIARYHIDFYAQLRRYELDGGAEPDLRNITVGTFGTKFTF